MRGDWGGGSNGRSGGNARPGAGAGRNNSGGAGPARGGSAPGAGRWSNELDAIFERAPKEIKEQGAIYKEDERSFFDERPEVKSHSLVCPNCNQPADYALTWLVRRKRDHPNGYVDDATRLRFEKARSYMVRRDDQVACQNVRCRKRFEIAGLQSVAFLQDAADGSVEDRAARVRAAFAGRVRE